MGKYFNSVWIIVGISFSTLALSYGVWHSFSVFFVALLKEFGWSRSITAGAFSVFAIFHFLVGPFVGNIVGRFEARRVVILGSLVLGLGLALCSFIQTWWQFYLFFGVITGIGVGSIGLVPNSTIIQQWFKKGRGLAMGIINSGIGFSILFFVPSIQYLVIRVGWRVTYRIMAIIMPLIIISLAIVFLRKSSQANASPRTERGNFFPEKNISSRMSEEMAPQSWTLRRAIATKPFWFVSVSWLLGGLSSQTIFAHQVAFLVDEGLEALFSSYIVGLVGIVSIGGKIFWGSLSDRIGREVTYMIGVASFILGMILLIVFSRFHFPNFLYFYALFFGLGYAAIGSVVPLIVADFFEGRIYGSILGTMSILTGAGVALGAWFAGYLHDKLGSYVLVFCMIIACVSLSCYFIWIVAPRKIRAGQGYKR